MNKKLLICMMAMSLMIPSMPVMASEGAEGLLVEKESQEIAQEENEESAETFLGSENPEEIKDEKATEISNNEELLEDNADVESLEEIEESVEEPIAELVEQTMEETIIEPTEESVENLVDEKEILLETPNELPQTEEVIAVSVKEAPMELSAISEESVVIEDEVLGKQVIEGNYRIDSHTIMSENMVINGDLTIDAILEMRGYDLTVNGDLIVNYMLMMGSGDLIVNGNLDCRYDLSANNGIIKVKDDLLTSGNYMFSVYNENVTVGNNVLITESNDFSLTGSMLTVGNDFRLCNIDEDGNYEQGNGRLSLGNELEPAQLSVGGDFYVNTDNIYLDIGSGTIAVKGDLTWVAPYGMDLSEVNLVLNGKNAQKVTLGDENYYKNYIGSLQIQNPNVTVTGTIHNAKLNSNAAIRVGDKGLSLGNIDLQGNSLTIYGDVVVAGNMDVEMASSHLTVTGDYTQTAGILKVGNGTVDIGGHLNLQGRDGFGNACLGSGSISMTETGGNLNIAKNLVLQTSTCGTYKYGILTLKGDLIQLADGVNIVAEAGHRVILPGERAQKVTFLNNRNTFNILEVKKPLKEYSFSPARCWKTLTGVVEWPFTDIAVRDGYWKYESVKFVYESNIMNGVGDGKKFNPDGTMTRAMFATVIYRMAGNPQVNYEPIFSDVPAGKWYSDAIVWAYRRGIVNGYPDGRFGHGDSITREQMAKMLKGYADVQRYPTYERGALTTFTDAEKVSGWAIDYMKWAVGSGMISGKENAGKKYLDPAGNATRAECATMLKRFIEKFQ